MSIGDDLPADDPWLDRLRADVENEPMYHYVPSIGDIVMHNGNKHIIESVQFTERHMVIDNSVVKFIDLNIKATVRKEETANDDTV